LRLSDGTVRRGRFVSVVRSSDAAYESEYEMARREVHELAALPPLGPAQIASADGQVTAGVLTGFDRDCVWFRTVAGGSPVRLDFTRVATIRAEGTPPLTSPAIARLVRLGAIPAISSVQLDAQPPVAPVPLNRIVEVSYRGSDGGTAGALVGLAVDALIVSVNVACAHSQHCFE
jgi:hypothetical protein